MNKADLQPVTLPPSAFGAVAVLMGGVSAEREISLQSGRATLDALLRSGVDAFGIDIQRDPFAMLEQLKAVDRAFIALHGPGGEDGCIQGLLQSLNIPFTGSGVLGSALAMDKVKTKQIWTAQGIHTPKSWVLSDETEIESFVHKCSQDTSRFPLIIKPVGEGSSLGMSKVAQVSALREALLAAFQYDPVVLVETFLPGPEYTVGILNGSPLPVIRINTKRDFYDYQAKYVDDDTEFLVPSGLDPSTEAALQKQALAAFQALGCRGWGRVDLLQDSQGEFSFIEVNTVPGLTTHSLVPKACAAAGLGFDDLVLQVLATSLPKTVAPQSGSGA